jgi:U3 small nucleolar RNA-associated protein 21
MGGREDGIAFRWYVPRITFDTFTMAYPGPDAPEHISSLTMDGDAVWAASSLFAIKYLRGKEVSRLTSTGVIVLSVIQVLRVSNPLGSNLAYLTVFGSQLLALDERGEHMLIWTSEGGEPSFCAFSPMFVVDFVNRIRIGNFFRAWIYGHLYSPSSNLPK